MSSDLTSADPLLEGNGPYHLCAFDRLMAPVVALWVDGPDELFRLAPQTPPPLTPGKVVAWTEQNGHPMLFYENRATEPTGYVELNPLPREKQHFWVGHCLIRPDRRGIGLGRRMVSLLLDEAFLHLRAMQVSLVVFPNNLAAVQCYRAAGFVDVGEQVKYFATTGRQHIMRRMTVQRSRYENTRYGIAPAP